MSGNPTRIPYKEIIDYLNEKTGKKFKHNTTKTKDFIKARWNQDFRLEDFKKVIDIKTAEWLNTDSDKYLRPETLLAVNLRGTSIKNTTNWHGSIGTHEVRRKLLGLGDIMKPLFSEKINESLKNINLLMSKRD